MTIFCSDMDGAVRGDRENVDESEFFAVLDPLLNAWATERQRGERFGDFLWRSGRLATAAATGHA